MSNCLKLYQKKNTNCRLEFLSIEATLVLCDVIMWAKQKQISCIITDAVTTLEEDTKLKRQSSTHREGRAFDISTKGWSRDLIDECIRVFSFKYRHLAAVLEDGSTKLVYYHDAGTGHHLHFQVAKRFAVTGDTLKVLA